MQKNQNLVDRALDLHLGEQKRKSAIKWSAFNIILLSILTFDIYTTSMYHDLVFYYIEVIALCILNISLIKNILTYLYYTFFVDQVVCENEDQRILLNLSSSNSMVKTKSTLEMVKKQDTDETVWGSVKNLSWQSWGDLSSANLSAHTSWISNNNHSNMNSTQVQSDANCSFISPAKFNKSEVIMDKRKMQQFLSDVAEQEKNVTSAVEAQQIISTSSFNSFWDSFSESNSFMASLKNLTYQLSPHSKQTRDESFSKKDEENAEIIRQMSANKLSNYVANMKMWIHKTILDSLVHAIDETDKAFEQRGFTDMRIGHCGIERLKKIATTNHCLLQSIPILPKLIPFLELTTNQEFLVQRLRELAKGSCLANYKFSTGSYEALSSQLNDHTPNDSGIIFHIFCTYLDSQLQPVPDVPRPFYSRYVTIGDSKKSNAEYLVKEATRNKAKCAILCSNQFTPKFNFITDKVHGSSYDRNNLFYVLIQFLFHLKQDGNVLENVSLGKSGLNLINVIED